MLFSTFFVGAAWVMACVALPLLNLAGLPEHSIVLYSSGIQIVAPLISAGLCLRASMAFRRDELMGKVWTLMALGVLAWGLGAILYAGYQITHDMDDPPYPWFSDLGYLLMPPILMGSLYLFIREMQVRVPIWGVILAAISFGGAMGMAVWSSLGNLAEAGGPIEFLVEVCYILFDPMLIGITVVSASLLAGGLVARPWWLTLGGVMLYYLGNVVFDLQEAADAYTTGGWVDVSWPLAFGMIAIGAMLTREMFLAFER